MNGTPKDLKKIAVSEDLAATVTFYYSAEFKQFFFRVLNKRDSSEQLYGPISNRALPMLIHCISDVQSMKGRFTWLD